MPGLTGAILVGGTSRRMGTNKALLSLAPDGPPIVETVVRTLERVTDEILLVGTGPDDDAYAWLGVRQVADVVPNAGALGGVHAALSAARYPRVLVVGCDMPFLSTGLLLHMASLPQDAHALVPLLRHPQPLHAIVERSSLPIIERQLLGGHLRMTGWYAQARVRIVPRAVVARFDPTLQSCFNMNTPGDLALAKRIATMRDPQSGGR